MPPDPMVGFSWNTLNQTLPTPSQLSMDSLAGTLAM